MKIDTKTQIMAPPRHLPFEVVSLVLHGAAALGADQEMTDMPRVRNPNAIGFPASDGLFEMSTEVVTGEVAPVGEGEETPSASIQPALQERGLS